MIALGGACGQVTMRRFVKFAAILVCIFWSQTASAQTWVQVEAQPTETAAIERAASYAARLPDVSVYRLGSGWHAIVIGPYSEDAAQLALLEMRAVGAVPSDAFLSDGSTFRDRLFGSDAAATTPAATNTPLPPLEAGEETVAQARRGEAQLTRSDREQIQIALRWEGYYRSTIDASFGPGTRRAMAAWQEANRFEPTGVLTTQQRRALVGGYQDVLQALGLRTIVDDRAGIQVDGPAAMVRFDRYDSPFAHYASASDDGVKLLLISQSGDRNTLTALYDIIQTLEIVPLDGPRSLGRNSFSIEGSNSDIQSYTFARLAGDAVKGFSLIWPAGDEKRFRLALSRMQETFRTLDNVLPDEAGQSLQSLDLMAGLQIRRPERTGSGFYIDSAGSVLAASDSVDQCTRVMLDGETEAVQTARDDTLGVVLLTPKQSLAPISIARLSTAQPRLQSDIAVSGYSFGGLLTAPSLTFGTLADIKGLDGNTNVQRLEVATEPGDAGGPVFDTSGAVLGMLLAQSKGARQLPASVAFAANAPLLAEFLSSNGVTAATAEPGTAMAPEDLTLLAADITVLVSCWN